MVSIAVTAAVPVIAAGWVTEQTGGSTEPAGPVTVHERATLPIKPPLGVTVIVEVPVAPGEAMVMVVLVKVKFGGRGGAVTVRGIWVVTVSAPDAPVTVIV
jgi:hypothetical protein